MSSDAKEEVNFKISPKIAEGLPISRGKYADNTIEADHHSFIAVRHTGSVDTRLWHDLNRHVYTPCFKGKISAVPIRDPVTMKLISGPLIIKTDAGPCRFVKGGRKHRILRRDGRIGRVYPSILASEWDVVYG